MAKLVAMGEITALEECTEARLFSVAEAESTEGWVQEIPSFASALLALRPLLENRRTVMLDPAGDPFSLFPGSA